MIGNKPSIMHVIDTLELGGAERMLVDIVNTIDPNRFTASVCVTRTGLDLAKEINPTIPVKILNRRSRFDFLGFYKLRKIIRKLQIDILHVHGRSSFQFVLVAKLLGFHNCLMVLHDHFGNIDIDESIRPWFKIIGSKFVDHYIGVCEKLADWAKTAGVPAKKISVLENSLDFHRFDQYQAHNLHDRLNIPSDNKIGIMVGNNRHAKGLDQLINACGRIEKHNLPFFIILGHTPQSEYMHDCYELLTHSGLSEHFNFVGQQPDPIRWMKGADFAVLPSRSESGPLVLIEYLACGLPFVAFNVGGISKQIRTHLPNFFVSPGNIDQFSTQLSKLMNTPNKMQDREDRKILARELFDIHHRMSSLYTIYTYCLRNRQ